MRVLLVQQNPCHHDHNVAAAFTRAGHEVVTCHDPDIDHSLCLGMHDDCPIERGLDVAVLLATSPEPTAFDDGARCAVRANVPFVVAGEPVENPYAEWTDAQVNPDDSAAVVATAEAVVSAPHSRLSGVVQAALDEHLRRHDLVGAGTAEVHRRRDQLVVTIELADSVPPEVRAQCTVPVQRALRDATDDARVIDLIVR